MTGWDGLFAALTDELGQPYDAQLLPCHLDPYRWDEDAPARVRRAAAQACLVCPALQACRTRADELGRLARGVWGGELLSRGSDDPTVIYDATVADWVRRSGIALDPRGSRP